MLSGCPTPAGPGDDPGDGTNGDDWDGSVSARTAAIESRWAELAPDYEGVTFDDTPSVSDPYATGTVNAEFIDDGVTMLNFLRFLAGLPDDVVNDATLTSNAQHGAVLMAAVQQLSHDPDDPGDMDPDFYLTADTACSYSNIGLGYSTFEQFAAGLMHDSSGFNLSTAGHRRWILNPQMQKTGFGFAMGGSSYYYMAMWAMDSTRSETFAYDTIAWPSGPAFPSDYFADDDPWTLTLNPSNYQSLVLEDVTVTVLDITEVITYTLDENDNTAASSGEYLNVSNMNYGVPRCIIFRPGDAVTYDDGDRFDITITGVRNTDGSAATIEYSVEFFVME
jgi:uncharacterized protein YkwD